MLDLEEKRKKVCFFGDFLSVVEFFFKKSPFV